MIESIEMKVTGMKCGGCETHVKTQLSAIAGVHKVEASFKDTQVRVAFDDSQTTLEAIKSAIAEAGFHVVAA